MNLNLDKKKTCFKFKIKKKGSKIKNLGLNWEKWRQQVPNCGKGV